MQRPARVPTTPVVGGCQPALHDPPLGHAASHIRCGPSFSDCVDPTPTPAGVLRPRDRLRPGRVHHLTATSRSAGFLAPHATRTATTYATPRGPPRAEPARLQ